MLYQLYINNLIYRDNDNINSLDFLAHAFDNTPTIINI